MSTGIFWPASKCSLERFGAGIDLFIMRRGVRMVNRVRASILLTGTLLVAASSPVFADTSWRWMTDTRPWHLLPVAVVLTVAIETLGIAKCGRVASISKVLLLVCICNLLSFGSTYLFDVVSPIAGFTIADFIEMGPYYNVGALFLIVTIAVEVPLVYLGLRRNTQSRPRLALAIFASNVLTTAAVAVTERLASYGRW